MRLGLTGGIGCGKSTVVQVFREAGWRALETDRIVADLLDHDESVRSTLRARWPEVISSEGARSKEGRCPCLC